MNDTKERLDHDEKNYMVYILRSDAYCNPSHPFARHISHSCGSAKVSDLQKVQLEHAQKGTYFGCTKGEQTLVAALMGIEFEDDAKEILSWLTTSSAQAYKNGLKFQTLRSDDFILKKIDRLIQILRWNIDWKKRWTQQQHLEFHLADSTAVDINNLPPQIKVVKLNVNRAGGTTKLNSPKTEKRTLLVFRSRTDHNTKTILCDPEQEEEQVNMHLGQAYTHLASVRNMHKFIGQLLFDDLAAQPEGIEELEWIVPHEYANWGAAKKKIYKLLQILSLIKWANRPPLTEPFNLWIANYFILPAEWLNVKPHVRIHRFDVQLLEKNNNKKKKKIEQKERTVVDKKIKKMNDTNNKN